VPMRKVNVIKASVTYRGCWVNKIKKDVITYKLDSIEICGIILKISSCRQML